MVSLVIANTATFGQMTNSVVSRIAGVNTSLLRLNEAVATASAGFTGTPGTEFEQVPPSTMAVMVTNNFGVQPDGENPGVNGQAFADAVTALTVQWQAFWTAAAPYLKTLDNGQPANTGGMVI